MDYKPVVEGILIGAGIVGSLSALWYVNHLEYKKLAEKNLSRKLTPLERAVMEKGPSRHSYFRYR
jgi:hypothetical protein